MTSTRDQALATLGLAATPDADIPTIQGAFERLARRYPQQHFPERFLKLLEARDQLLDASRAWREQLESRTLDLAWALPHLRADVARESILQRRTALQNLLRAGYLAEPLAPERGDDPEDIPF